VAEEIPTEQPPTQPSTESAEVAAAPTVRRRSWFRRLSRKPATDPVDASTGAESAEVATTPVSEEAASEPVAEESAASDATETAEATGTAPVADTGDAESTEASTDGEPTVDAAEQTPVAEPKPITRAVTAAVAVAATLFVAAAAFAGAMLEPYLADRALVHTKLDIAHTAANAITTLWTYTPADMDRLPDRSAKYLTGDFEDQYRKYVDAIAPTNKQAQVSNNTQVMGAAVESLEGSNASAVVYTNSTYTSPVTKNVPSLRYLSYRLIMERKNSQWLITKMTTVTSLDLTPKLAG
jgi:Mce-associated membrane protein